MSRTWRGSAVLVGWVLGVALQLQQPALGSLGAYAAVALAGAAGWMAAARMARPALVIALALLAGVGIGWGVTGARAAWFAAGALDPGLQGVDIQVTGRIASLPQRSAQGERFELVVESARRAGGVGEALRLPHRVQLGWYAAAEGDPSPRLRAGNRWRFTVRLRSPHGNANPHGFDRERWLWEQGIQATGYVRSGPRDPAPQHLGATPWHPLDRARQAVAARIDERVTQDPRSAGVLAALVVGDQSAIVVLGKRVVR